LPRGGSQEPSRGDAGTHRKKATMSETDFVLLGFSLMGNGALRAPSNSRVTLVRDGDDYELKIALRTGNSIICSIPASDLKITRARRT
jgi:hypothetical protein